MSNATPGDGYYSSIQASAKTKAKQQHIFVKKQRRKPTDSLTADSVTSLFAVHSPIFLFAFVPGS